MQSVVTKARTVVLVNAICRHQGQDSGIGECNLSSPTLPMASPSSTGVDGTEEEKKNKSCDPLGESDRLWKVGHTTMASP